jgi:hypothetical protein
MIMASESSQALLFRNAEPLGSRKDAYFDPELLHLSGAMTAQSVVKHLLTEGDKLLISRLSPLADQGGFAIASNYGASSYTIQYCQLTTL